MLEAQVFQGKAFPREAEVRSGCHGDVPTLAEYLGIELTELGADYLTGTMRVDHRTCQPMRLLHGGASVALAETLGSLAANAANRDPERHFVGQEINANHIRSAKNGLVTGIATPIHLGKSSHVWEIKIYDDAEKLICISRLTVAILKKK